MHLAFAQFTRCTFFPRVDTHSFTHSLLLPNNHNHMRCMCNKWIFQPLFLTQHNFTHAIHAAGMVIGCAAVHFFAPLQKQSITVIHANWNVYFRLCTDYCWQWHFFFLTIRAFHFIGHLLHLVTCYIFILLIKWSTPRLRVARWGYRCSKSRDKKLWTQFAIHHLFNEM